LESHLDLYNVYAQFAHMSEAKALGTLYKSDYCHMSFICDS